MARSVDLVISFTAAKKTTLSSFQLKKEAQRAKKQYSRLLETLTYQGFRAVGRRGESLGHLLLFISCPKELLDGLVKRER
jgi:anoctamin-10